VRHHGHAGSREDHQTHREQQDRTAVGVEVDQRGLQGGGVQQRREQSEQRHLRAQLDLRGEREQRGRHPHHDQQQGWRDADPLGDRRPGEHDHGQRDQQEGDLHGPILPGHPAAALPPDG
jgi:hypothetical protein